MTTFSTRYRRIRRVRRRDNNRGQKIQRREGQYDTDGLARQMGGSPDRRGRSLSQVIQAKLSVGAADDAYEKEADRTADQVVRSADQQSQSSVLQKQQDGEEAQPKHFLQRMEEEEAQPKQLLQRQQEEEEEAQAKPLLQRQQEEEEEEAQAKSLLQRQPEEEEEEAQAKPLLQRQQEEEEEEAQAKSLLQRQPEEEEEEEAQAKPGKDSSSSASEVSGHTASRIATRKGMGSPMSGNTRHFMQGQFQRDFSAVRIHNDSEAQQISQKLNAQAFTLGQDIYFNSGRYNPDSREGKHLLAHELTHVVQQNSGLKKKSENEIQRKCNPAPGKVNPKVRFRMNADISDNASISSWGRTHHEQVTVTRNRMKFRVKKVCGHCGPDMKQQMRVVYPLKANIKARIPVSINKAKIKKRGAKGERYYIDRKNVMKTGFYTAADASANMTDPVPVTVAMTKKHELHHVQQIAGIVRKQLKSRKKDIGSFCPYTRKKGKAWQKMMRGGWSGTVTWYSKHAKNTPAREKAARKHSF